MKIIIARHLAGLIAFSIMGLITLIRPNLAFAASLSVDNIYTNINQSRIQNNLQPLKINSNLTLAAERKAQDMLTYGYWAHTNPVTGSTPWKFILEAGYKGRYAGENLAKDYPDTDTVVNAWMNSTGHKQNILSSNYKETGIAIAYGVVGNEHRTIIVQMFGGPKK